MASDGKNELYGPRFRDDIKGHYRVWLVIVSVIILFVGVGMLIATALLKKQNSDIDNSVFIVWAAAPVIIVSVFGLIASLTKRKELLSIFLLLALFTVVLSAFAACNNGLRYWKENWKVIRKQSDGCKDSSANIRCGCVSVALPYPFESTSCVDLSEASSMLIAQITLSAISVVFVFAGVFLAMMIICCGRWAYIGSSKGAKEYNGYN